MATYTILEGRVIYRDGKPWLVLELHADEVVNYDHHSRTAAVKARAERIIHALNFVEYVAQASMETETLPSISILAQRIAKGT